jgi:hypothetical protein
VAAVVARQRLRLLAFYSKRENRRYLILGTGKSCERAIAKAVIVEESIGQQK